MRLDKHIIQLLSLGSVLVLLAACGGGGGGGSAAAPLTPPPPSGSLDTSFDSDGKVTTDLGSDFDNALALALQADGKIVTVGYTNLGSSTDDFAVVRYNANGSLDTSFDIDGKVRTDFTGGSDMANAVAIHGDTQNLGKIVVAGTSPNINGELVFALARYNADGSLDAGFGAGGAAGDGRVRTGFGGSATFSVVYGVAIQTDGKIVAAGITDSGGTEDFALARYNADGSLDLTFGPNGNGKVTTNFAAADDDGAYAVAIQPDGKIVLAGSSLNGINQRIALARYTVGDAVLPDGSLDPSFNGDGMVATPGNLVARALAIQNDGKIVVAGYTDDGGDRDILLARYLSNGTLDTVDFAPPLGLVITDISGNDDEARGVAIQPDGKIVVTGYTGTGAGTEKDFAFLRYNTGGNLDATFSPSDGLLALDLGGGGAIGKAVAIQSDGKIVAVASPIVTSSGNDFALVRVNP